MAAQGLAIIRFQILQNLRTQIDLEISQLQRIQRAQSTTTKAKKIHASEQEETPHTSLLVDSKRVVGPSDHMGLEAAQGWRKITLVNMDPRSN